MTDMDDRRGELVAPGVYRYEEVDGLYLCLIVEDHLVIFVNTEKFIGSPAWAAIQAAVRRSEHEEWAVASEVLDNFEDLLDLDVSLDARFDIQDALLMAAGYDPACIPFDGRTFKPWGQQDIYLPPPLWFWNLGEYYPKRLSPEMQLALKSLPEGIEVGSTFGKPVGLTMILKDSNWVGREAILDAVQGAFRRSRMKCPMRSLMSNQEYRDLWDWVYSH